MKFKREFYLSYIQNMDIYMCVCVEDRDSETTQIKGARMAY